MLYKQHKCVGDHIIAGNNLSLPSELEAAGLIVFSQKENIEYTSQEFFNEIKKYNLSITNLNIADFWLKVERNELDVNVRRTFGDINAWAGDHAKITPPDGHIVKFEDLKIKLQVVANTHDFDYLSLAIGNWDHFMPMSYKMWEIFHEEALRLAADFARSDSDSVAFEQDYDSDGNTPALVFDLDSNDLAKALFLEAYGCHFLEDSFVSGHLRTPRLLFGKDMDSLRSKVMHDKDNELRITGRNKANESFRLIGEDENKDDFSDPAALENDNALKEFFNVVTDTVAISVQQLIDTAYATRSEAEIQNDEIGRRVPQLSISWRALDEQRSRTHALEICPTGLDSHTLKPLYKFHANYDKDENCFKDACLFKNDEEGSWRRVLLSDVDYFTPGKDRAWWVPETPDDTVTIP